MKQLRTIGLAAILLVGLAVPASAFDQSNWENHGIAWAVKNGQIIDNMKNGQTLRTLDKLADNNHRYINFLDPLTPNTCQASHGYNTHHQYVLGYGIAVIDAWLAADNRHYRSASRHIKRAVTLWNKADDTGSRLIRAC